MVAKKATLLKLAERGSLRFGSTQINIFADVGSGNPRLQLTLPAGRVVGYVAFHAEYRSDLDRQIVKAIENSRPQAR